jgi:diguanylate cyclase (GGDEF)-like protein
VIDQSLETVLRLYTPERGVFTVALMHDVLVSRQTMEVPAHCFLLQRSSAPIAIEATFSPIERGFNQVMGVVIIFRDVSQKRERERILTQQATHDRLTNLPNRFLFESQVHHWMLAAKPVTLQKQIAILFLDLDGFKAVNDSLGHDMGDLLLVKVSERLKHCIRSVDLVCRQGGDEFVIAISKVDSPQLVASIAANIMMQLRHPFVLQHQSVKVGVSIGIALFPLDGKEVSELIKKADIAMYEAKARGKNRFLFYHELLDLSPHSPSSTHSTCKIVAGQLSMEKHEALSEA